MAKYLSIDTETTGLHLDCHLIQVAFLPVDSEAAKVDLSLGKEVLISCPSFEELKPSLNSWVIDHNETLIRKAHAEGIDPSHFKTWVTSYFADPKIKAFFGNDKPPLLGKSLSALDIPVLTRYLGKDTMDRYFHHHTVDITSVARSLVDATLLPKGSEGTTRLVQFFQMKSAARHTAMSDAVDMAEIYLKIVQFLKSHRKPAS
jgi:oligoribonuclease (3'-5' exoribonuclease)